MHELRSLGVGASLKLPQLVVCGDQSAAKQCVLQALSNVSFPKVSQFASELTLCRSAIGSIKHSILPCPSRSAEESQRLLAFASSKEPLSNLRGWCKKTSECLGITNGVSEDVLKFELSGLGQQQLTVVDLPNLLCSAEDQDCKTITYITERYIKTSDNVILAVKFDPERKRTLGIITWPDLLKPGSEEEKECIRTLKNETIRLQLGWHVLPNGDQSSQTQDPTKEIHDEEEMVFFALEPWKSLPRVKCLRQRLKNIVLEHARHNLLALGLPRSTLQQQRGYLLDIGSRFERIVKKALTGVYPDGQLYDFRRLRSVVSQLNEHFVDPMFKRGSRRHIIDNNIVPRVQSIKNKMRQSRGAELTGSSNQFLIGAFVQDQSQPWNELAKMHIMRQKMLEKLDELTAHTKRGRPLPLVRNDRVCSSAETSLAITTDHPTALSQRNSTESVRHPVLNQEAFRDDPDLACYESTLMVFSNNVATLRIETSLLDPLERILTPLNINSMEDVHVQRLAAEPAHLASEKECLNKDIEKLQAALQILNLSEPMEMEPSWANIPALEMDQHHSQDLPEAPVDAVKQLSWERPHLF
ncbi:P-loop containing nucleoside triphosphate hydrolase protein [Aspergillus pseudoustus]|uniref:P-loop containing nucleoside triphosphate hydrolase protein n=1 Tax=Aspergillus pseudoustus TaxID=1810923 RepID=A0ABR4KRT4_9EURO